MSDDHESQWLRDRMKKLRQRRNMSGAAFERIWSAAQAQQASLETAPAAPAWKFATASLAAILLAVGFAFHTAAERKHRRQQEREFAAVDGALMTYWQAPSDDLLPISNGTELPNRDE